MEVVYLGVFERVLEWVLEHIFEPVYSFVSGLLTTVLTWVFQEILAPILMPILKEALNFLIDLWMQLYSTQLYLLFSGVLKLIDYLQTAFDVFIGLEDVTYKEAGGTVISGSLVEVLMQQKTVSTVFWLITLGALGLALMLTIYATAKSAFDLDFENKRPVSKVLAAMMKTFIQFFTVPFLTYFLLKLSAVILKGVTSALTPGGTTTLGRIVFTIASLNAAKNPDYNLATAAEGITLGTSAGDIIRYPFYTTDSSGISVALRDYGNLDDVLQYFDLASFDYLIGFIAAVFLLFTIGVCLIVFVQRIFELILLYIVSPYFVCMIPLDDGEKFGRWREMFVAKCFTGFGSAIGMRLYLLVCPIVMGNQIRFGSASSPEMDYMMKLFFLAGGAWAVYKSGSMITTLLNFQAGMSESNTSAMAGGMLFAYTAGTVMSKGRQALGSAFGSKGGRGGSGSSGAGRDGGGSGSRFMDENDDIKSRYTGVTGWAGRHVMASQRLNRKIDSVMGSVQDKTLKAVNVNKKVEKAAGYASAITGWMGGKDKAPEKRNLFQRAAFGVSVKTGNLERAAHKNVEGLNRIGRRMEEIQEASRTKWGLLSLESDRLKSDKTDFHKADGSLPAIEKAEGSIGGAEVKYSDISIKGLDDGIFESASSGGGVSGSGFGSSSEEEDTAFTGSGGAAGSAESGSAAASADGGSAAASAESGSAAASADGGSAAASADGGVSVHIRHTVSAGTAETRKENGVGRVNLQNMRHTINAGSYSGRTVSDRLAHPAGTVTGRPPAAEQRDKKDTAFTGAGDTGNHVGRGTWIKGSRPGPDRNKINVQIGRRNPK